MELGSYEPRNVGGTETDSPSVAFRKEHSPAVTIILAQ